jgi:hypothetical protein
MTRRLDTRTLNRTLLARQLLLHREQRSAEEAITHLVGLQAQNPTDPHIALWSRLEDFDTSSLDQLLLDRRTVRCWPMRKTVHLVTAADAKTLLPLLRPVAERTLRGGFGRDLDGVDLADVEALGRKLLTDEPRTRGALMPHLTQRWPDHDRNALSYAATIPLPLVQLPPRGLWGQNGPAMLTPADVWLDTPLDVDPRPDEIVLRYLSAFGPARNADISTWSGMTGVKEITERLRPQLRTYRDEDGRELFDAPDATLTEADRPAPVRFLPEFDNVFLSHKDRGRIVASSVSWIGSITVSRTVRKLLIDGFVDGEWDVSSENATTTLTIQPYRRLTGVEESDLTAEGARLLTLLAPGDVHDVVVKPPA